MKFEDLEHYMMVVDRQGNYYTIQEIMKDKECLDVYSYQYGVQNLYKGEVDFSATAEINDWCPSVKDIMLPKPPNNSDEPSYKTISSTVYTDYNRGIQEKPKRNKTEIIPCETCMMKDGCKAFNNIIDIEGLRKMRDTYDIISYKCDWYRREE